MNIHVVEARTQIIMVDPYTGAISVINGGPQGPPGASDVPGPPGPAGPTGPAGGVTISGAETITGVKTFTNSPIAPNPVVPAGATKLITYGEVVDLLAALPTLAGCDTIYKGKFGTDPAFGQKVVGNTTVEGTLLGSTPTIPTMPLGSTANFVIAGDLRNSSGSAATLTLRFKVAGTTKFTIAASIPNDANTRRFKFTMDLQMYASSSATMSGDLMIGKGATATSYSDVEEAVLSAQGGSPQAWDVTAQWSLTNATTTLQRLMATLTYSLGA